MESLPNIMVIAKPEPLEPHIMPWTKTSEWQDADDCQFMSKITSILDYDNSQAILSTTPADTYQDNCAQDNGDCTDTYQVTLRDGIHEWQQLWTTGTNQHLHH